MEHTWHENHLPRLQSWNALEGDVTVCGSQQLTAALHANGPGRIAFAAPLDTRSDLEWLLRGLSIHPNVRHLVLTGDDPKAIGETLVALWKGGADENGQLPGGRGSLANALDRSRLDALRNEIQLTDLRGEAALAGVSGRISELTTVRLEREPVELPNPQIPDRKVFLSRKTTFPIFSSAVGDSWLQLLNLAFRIGTDKAMATGDRYAEALNAIVTIETPVLEDGDQEASPEFPEYFEFNQGDFERRYLPHHRIRLRGTRRIDPIDGICTQLEDAPESVAVMQAPLDDGASPGEMLLSASYNAIDGDLFASFVLRSCDLYNDWPLEATALVRQQREIAARLGLGVGSATFVIHSARLAESDFGRACELLGRAFKRPLPLHVDPSGVFLFGNDGGKARAMLLNHDASDIMWEEAFSDPEDLSWYIVDVMPWLLPQHIRYVGQECASLMRSMSEGECYLQG